jgi:hypothetical protein|tara:strand:+ start:3861 stop:4595 length:735 start_codon:yes stop_codon:yes gene_type:complete
MVAKGYTTEALVEAEILTGITTTSNPTTAEVAQWIEEAEAEVDELTQTSFTTTTVTNEVIPYDERTALSLSTVRSDYKVRRDTTFDYDRDSFFLTEDGFRRSPITSITSLSRNTASDGETDSFTALTEQTGSGGDFIWKKNGLVTFVKVKPNFGNRRGIKTTYTYGHTSIPNIVKTLTTKMVAKRVIQAKANRSQISSIDPISLEGISLGKGITQTSIYLQQLEREIRDLMEEVVGTFRTELVV